jgi:hypothetical protein
MIAATVALTVFIPAAMAQESPPPVKPTPEKPAQEKPVVPPTEKPVVPPGEKPETPPVTTPTPPPVVTKPSVTEEAVPVPVKRARLDAITFDIPRKGGAKTGPAGMYVPLRAAADQLGWYVDANDGLKVNGVPVTGIKTERLLHGTRIVTISDLKKMGANVWEDPASGVWTVASKTRAFEVAPGVKRVEVDIATQTLTAFQGEFVVLKTNVSTGRGDGTPRGDYTTTRYKTRMHYSSLYNNSPMPYSVQFNGNIFFHGYSSVPSYPASHGCVRMPMTDGNPAEFLYHWIDPGTPVKIDGHWKGRRSRG